MSNFSPYIYELERMPQVELADKTANRITQYYDHFTFLSKPIERNVYKISLCQILRYLVDFGIGYNSVCETTITTQQEFSSTMYVNRHSSRSSGRPATVADLKEKLRNAMEILIKQTVKSDKRGVKVTNKVYPKYFFTLDTNLTPVKLKQLTGKDYVKVDFTDFPFTRSSTSSSTITRANGYVPADSLLMCPKHKHEPNDKIKKSISYSWSIGLHPDGRTGWVNHMTQVLGRHIGFVPDSYVGVYWNTLSKDKWAPEDVATNPITPSWQFPTSVSCYMSDPVYPKGTTTVGGVKSVSIRYPGRRYILFKQVQ